jgi:hypothetical protein
VTLAIGVTGLGWDPNGVALSAWLEQGQHHGRPTFGEELMGVLGAEVCGLSGAQDPGLSANVELKAAGEDEQPLAAGMRSLARGRIFFSTA